MDESQLLVQAVVKVPLFPSFNIIVQSLLKRVAEGPWDMAGSDVLSDKCRSLIAQTCLQLVSVSYSTLTENLAPLASYWCNKAQKLKVPPEQCFFGIHKKDIMELMKKVLLEYLMKVCQRKKRFVGCISFYNLIHMLAEEVTKKVNTHLALMVHSPTLLNSECQCIPLPILNILIHRLANWLRCWHQGKCKCPLLKKSVFDVSPPVATGQPSKRRLCVKLGIFEVMYTSSDVQIMHILSYITDFTYACNVDVKSPVPFQRSSCLVESHTHRSIEACEVSMATNREICAAAQENLQSPPVASPPDQTEAVVVVEDSLAEPQPSNNRTEDVSSDAAPPQEVGPMVDTEAPQSPAQMTELDKKHDVVILLLVGLLLLTQEKAQMWLSQEESDTAIKKLSERAKSYTARFEDITVSSKRSSVDRTSKKLFKYFCKIYSSPRELLLALISQDQKTIIFIVTALMSQLALWSSTRHAPIARCFSRVGKAVARPFRACFKALTQ